MGILFGMLGLITGMVWAQFTWGAWWSGDPKQNASAIGLLMYLAYTVLRSSFEDKRRQARISAAYNILAFFCLIPLLFILPRLTDSLHPGNGEPGIFGLRFGWTNALGFLSRGDCLDPHGLVGRQSVGSLYFVKK